MDENCPRCTRPVRTEFVFCPWCGVRRWPTCNTCHTIITTGWQYCPRCGAAIEQAQTVTPARGVRASPADAESDPEKLNQQGMALYDQERYDEAIHQFLKAVELNPQNAVYHANLAVAYHDNNMPDQALDAYKQAIALDPKDTTSRLNLGHLYSSLEDKDNARDCYQQVIALAPESEDAAEARQALADLSRL
jgi:Flp pilus assembly protein TadD